MNSELQTILGDFILIDDVSVPVAQIKYTGNESTYVVWSIVDETPALNANDEDLASVVSVDIDIFSITNYLKIVKEIKKIMKANEWVWTGDSVEMFDENTGLYYKTCSFEKERMIENG